MPPRVVLRCPICDEATVPHCRSPSCPKWMECRDCEVRYSPKTESWYSIKQTRI